MEPNQTSSKARELYCVVTFFSVNRIFLEKVLAEEHHIMKSTH